MSLNYKEEYEKWLDDPYIDQKTKNELKNIKDDDEIQDRFYKGLEFGTAGMRGLIGAGLNRMNRYVVERTTQALADVLIDGNEENKEKGVVISYDCRHFSEEFAWTCARVLAGNGIKAYIYDEMRPTPQLSFSVRHLNCASGIMITASHNPKDYNGYKVYNRQGSQILSEFANDISQEKESIKDFDNIKKADKEQGIKDGLIEIIGENTDRVYLDKVKSLSLIDPDISKDINIVYTPLNGTGSNHMLTILRETGFNNVYPVKEQQFKDPNFTTVGYPNPENVEAFEYAKKYGTKHNGDLLLATDPDADRLAIMVKNKDDEYEALTGNQTGALFISYILASRKDRNNLPENGAIVKSVVTGGLGDEIAESYGIKTFETLTGFKNICAKANQFEKTGQYVFLLGYEESIGYNAGTFVRDKDAISSGMLICEACAYYKSKNKTLLEVLEELYSKFGYYEEKVMNIILEGIKGQEIIDSTMSEWRDIYFDEFNGSKLEYIIDYKTGIKKYINTNKEEDVNVRRSDVLKFMFDNGCWYAIRPSGTEPKLKVYLYSKGESKKHTQENLSALEKEINKLLFKTGAKGDN